MSQKQTKYSSKWEKTRAQLERDKNLHSAWFTLCNKQFSVSGGDVSQVILYEKSQSQEKAVPFQTQSQLKILFTGHIAHTHGGLEVLSTEMQALKD